MVNIMSVQLRDVALLSGVSMVHVYQLIRFARRTGAIRYKYELYYPAMSGNEDVERALRAQQNTLEFFPIFSTSFWLAGIYLHQVPVSIVGLFYMYARQKYYDGYCESVEGRLPGFRDSVKALRALIIMFGIGFTNFILEEFTGISLKEQALKLIPIKF